MSEMEHRYDPATIDRYHAREKALNSRIVKPETMLFRRKQDGSIERCVVPEKNVDPRHLSDGWVDSRGKCQSDEIYAMAQERPEWSVGQIKVELSQRQSRKAAGFERDIQRAVAERQDGIVTSQETASADEGEDFPVGARHIPDDEDNGGQDESGGTDRAELEVRYKERYGKKPHWKMSDEKLLELLERVTAPENGE